MADSHYGRRVATCYRCNKKVKVKGPGAQKMVPLDTYWELCPECGATYDRCDICNECTRFGAVDNSIRCEKHGGFFKFYHRWLAQIKIGTVFVERSYKHYWLKVSPLRFERCVFEHSIRELRQIGERQDEIYLSHILLRRHDPRKDPAPPPLRSFMDPVPEQPGADLGG